ncbi:hypothetical protein D3C75_1132910 [compost metagenome]
MANCRLPSSAEALPACAPCPAIAQAEAFGSTMPRVAMQQNSGTSSDHSAAGCHSATPNSASAQSR